MKKYLFLILCAVMLCFTLSACSLFCEHEFGAWETVKSSTCIEKGEKAHTCTVCGKKETEKLELSEDHEVDEKQICKLCGNLIYEEITLLNEHLRLIGYTGQSEFEIPSVFQDNDGKHYKVVAIGEGLFHGDDRIYELTIPESVERIEHGAFAYCTNLGGVVLPDTAIRIGSRAFDDTDLYTNKEYRDSDGCLYVGNHLIVAANGMAGDYNVKPGTITIAGSAFFNCPYLKNVTLPESLKLIGNDAFSLCRGITEITLPKGLEKIEAGAFANCSISNIVIPEEITSMENGVFEGNNFTSVILPDSVTRIGDDAFKNCYSLNSIVFPKNLTHIGKAAFDRCYKLDGIAIPDSVISIGENAFKDTVVYVNEANWENDALYIGKHLVNVKNTVSGKFTVKEGTLSVAGGVFRECHGIDEVIIPEGVKIIGNSTFENCSKLKSVTLPKGLISIGASAFMFCEKLKVISIPDTVVSIESSAFMGCFILNELVIPNGVKVLQNSLFSRCDALTKITIPSSVKEIEAHVFLHCHSLTTIEFQGTTEQWNNIIKCTDRDLEWNQRTGIYTVVCTDGTIKK